MLFKTEFQKIKASNAAVKERHDLRKTLNVGNQRYYDDFSSALYAEGGGRDQRILRETLDNVLGEIVAADQRNQQAVDYFKVDPAQLASDLLSEMGPDRQHLTLVFLGCVLAVWIVATLILDGGKPRNGWLDFASTLIMAFGMYAYGLTARRLMRRLFPQKDVATRKRYAFYSIGLLGILLLLVIFALYRIFGQNI